MTCSTGGSIAPQRGGPHPHAADQGSSKLDSNILLIASIVIVGLIGLALLVAGSRGATGPGSGPLARIRAVVDQSIGMEVVRRLSGPPSETAPAQMAAAPRRPLVRDAGVALVGIAAVALVGVVVIPGFNGGHPTSSHLTVSRAHSPSPNPNPTAVPATPAPLALGPAESFLAQTVGKSTTQGRISWAGPAANGGIAKYELQVSVNGGKFTPVALSSATATSIDRPHTDDKSYRYRVRATDKQGKVSAWVNGPTWKPGRIQDTSSSIKYKGSWVMKSNTLASGGSHRYSSSLKASASITRSVRDFAWVATRTAKSGSAQVWIDGALAATIDLRSPTAKYRQVVFSRHFLALGTHTMEVRPIGDGVIHVDAFLVIR